MEKETTADKQADIIMQNHVVYSAGAGLVPIPALDIASVSAIQLDMLKQLADTYKVDFSRDRGKSPVLTIIVISTAIAGGSLVKMIPFVSGVIGGFPCLRYRMPIRTLWDKYSKHILVVEEIL